MCRFVRVHHNCGHVALLTLPTSIQLCHRALAINLTQGTDKAPAFCTPLGPNGRDDLYNEDLVSEIEEDLSYCPTCHIEYGTPACGDGSDHSQEEEGLNEISSCLSHELYGIVKANKKINGNPEVSVLVTTIEHDWLRSMLTANTKGHFELSLRVFRFIETVNKAISEVLEKCNGGFPLNSVTFDCNTAWDKFVSAAQLLGHFHQIVELVEDLEQGKRHYNEICKQAELCKLILDGPLAIPADPEHLYLQPGMINTPLWLQAEKNVQESLAEVSSDTEHVVSPVKEKIKYRPETLPFRGGDHYHPGARESASGSKHRPPPVTVFPLSEQRRARFGKLEVRYFSERPAITRRWSDSLQARLTLVTDNPY